DHADGERDRRHPRVRRDDPRPRAARRGSGGHPRRHGRASPPSRCALKRITREALDMPYRDLREYLTVLEEAGKLHHIRTEVDKTWEIAAVSRLAFQEIPEERRPALMFDRVAGRDIPLRRGVLGASRW